MSIALHQGKIEEDEMCIDTTVQEKNIPFPTDAKQYRKIHQRWGIEPQFRDSKDLHFGMGLAETRISSVERRDRLLLISALSVIILTLLGAAGEQLGMDRRMKANTVKHRTHSLFRQGCYYYSRLSTMKTDELSAFLNAFTALLLERKVLNEILWVI